jgi:hypothetical protein
MKIELKSKYPIIILTYVFRGFNPMCPLHPRNQCETYCLDCRRRICVQCIIKEHQTHHVEMLEDYLGHLFEKRERGLQQVANLKVTAGDHLRALQAENGKVTKELEEQYQRLFEILKAAKDKSLRHN